MRHPNVARPSWCRPELQSRPAGRDRHGDHEPVQTEPNCGRSVVERLARRRSAEAFGNLSQSWRRSSSASLFAVLAPWLRVMRTTCGGRSVKSSAKICSLATLEVSNRNFDFGGQALSFLSEAATPIHGPGHASVLERLLGFQLVTRIVQAGLVFWKAVPLSYQAVDQPADFGGAAVIRHPAPHPTPAPNASRRPRRSRPRRSRRSRARSEASPRRRLPAPPCPWRGRRRFANRPG